MKMSGIGKVLENSFLYTFSSILVKAIGFLLLPVYTLFLTPDDYGVVNLINSFIQVATFIVAFSLYSAVIRFYADYKDDKEKVKRFYGTVIIFVFISAIVFACLGLLFNELLISWFFIGISFYPVVLIALLTLIFVSLHTSHQNILQGMQQGRKLTIINLLLFMLQVCLNLFLIVTLKLGAVGVLLATLIVNIGYSFYIVYDLKNNNMVAFCIDRKILIDALKYSIPILPHNISTNIAGFASRVFINHSVSLASVGLYGIASQFGMLIDTVQASVNKAFAPWFYNMMNANKEESKKDVVTLAQFLLILYSLLFMIIGLFSQEIIILMTTEKYIMAWTVIPIFVMAFSIKSIYYFYVNILFYHKDASRKIFIATITGSIINIYIAFVLTPKYGIYGAAVAFLIAKVIVVVIVVVMSKRCEDIGYKITDMLKIIIPGLLFMGIGLYFSYTIYIVAFSWLNLFYKVSILTAYLIYIYLTNKSMINMIIKSNRIHQILKGKLIT